MEIAAAADRIKEEVDEDANIIFGSSFNEALEGKIRVSVVATGIGNAVAGYQPKKSQIPDYIDQSYITPEEAAPKEEITLTVEPSVQIQPVAQAETKSEEVEQIADDEELFSDDFGSITDEISHTEPFDVDSINLEEDSKPLVNLAHDKDFDNFEDIDMLENSKVVDDMPRASSLFNAIINKDEEAESDDDLKAVLPDLKDSFEAKTVLTSIESEPELFTGAQVTAGREEKEEEEVLIPQSRTPTFIERITGISIAKRKRKPEEQKIEPKAEPKLKSTDDFGGDDIFDDDEKLNLDIPSFLRRS